MNKYSKDFGRRMGIARVEKGISQEALAKAVNTNAKTIRRWEMTGICGFEDACLVAKELQIPLVAPSEERSERLRKIVELLNEFIAEI